MRIIAGENRGRPLKALKGEATRPTTDRVKESVMSTLYSALDGFDGVRVLDAFAGTGNLGLEALSRGAARCVFCEQAREAQRIIEENIRACKVPRERFRLLKADTCKVERLVPTGPFDLVFLDPPYRMEPEDVFAWIRSMDQAGALAAEAVVSYEYAKRNAREVATQVDALEWATIATRTYGDTCVVILRKETR